MRDAVDVTLSRIGVLATPVDLDAVVAAIPAPAPVPAASAPVAPVAVASPTTIVDRVVSKRVQTDWRRFATAFKDHPRQRDTARHAEIAKKKHLAAPSPTHADVIAAYWNGQLWKVDGHTRAHLWLLGELPPPPMVDVRVFVCTEYADLLELYNHYDNKSAVETTADRLSGAVIAAGLKLNSPALRKYGFGTALQIAQRGWGGAEGDGWESEMIYASCQEFKRELLMLDTLNPSASIFYVGVIAGALMALRKYGDKILPFFEALNKDQGVKTATTSDAVFALSLTIKTSGKQSFNRNLELAAKTISCVERYIKGETYAAGKGSNVKKTAIGGYLTKHPRTVALPVRAPKPKAKRGRPKKVEAAGVAAP